MRNSLALISAASLLCDPPAQSKSLSSRNRGPARKSSDKCGCLWRPSCLLQWLAITLAIPSTAKLRAPN
eukprot:1862560-Amphidinium_carterae.1